MKKIVLILLISAAGIFAQTQKIGYVDSQVILERYSAAIKAQSDLDAIAKFWNAQIDSMKLALQNDYATYQKQAGSMTEEMLQTKQQELVQKEQKIQAFAQAKFGQPDGEYFKKQEELMAPVRKKIIDTIDVVAKQQEMKFVFDKAGDVILLYADPEYDVTFKVLDLLRK